MQDGDTDVERDDSLPPYHLNQARRIDIPSSSKLDINPRSLRFRPENLILTERESFYIYRFFTTIFSPRSQFYYYPDSRVVFFTGHPYGKKKIELQATCILYFHLS